jgi:hypothetical protein
LESLEKVKSHISKVESIVQTHKEKLVQETEQMRIDLETKLQKAEQKREEILEKKIETAQKCGLMKSASKDILPPPKADE